ncbi:hypothetical protein LCM10_08410 [Rossellomorea aquimaris]|uniref:hypothetical protein n=1 Tax=Rossellomorea aquimaris TaxID=189382 RepID=UPI001CD72EDE|nr:hypothetical protein [Rossellomorea aquimaris]MCA1055005.1 hypothetical protein [Rossellomorea aquimaris]
MKKRLSGIVVSTTLLITLTACSSNEPSVNTSGPDASAITMDEFAQITKGMELEEVFDIIGGEGKLQGESGKEGTVAHKVSYVWDGASANSFVSISFLNNKVNLIKDVNMR